MEKVVVIGAGIAGLATALSLAGEGREVVIVERDAEPPQIQPEQAFEAWQRPGVPQFRHAHILLARARTIIRDRYPELFEELLAAGLEESTLDEVLPPVHEGTPPLPGDDDLLHFWGRRPTFEYVIRKHVERLPHVRFVNSAKVTGLSTRTEGNAVVVSGVRYQRGALEESLTADLVVDASGRRSKCPAWLAAQGVVIETVDHPSGFIYSCRHYRLKDPESSPPRRDGGGNLDYLGYATFYAEHGHYALTFGCPVEEEELSHAIRRREGFEALTTQFPVLQSWTDVSEAESKVLGAGKFGNRWTHYKLNKGKGLLGFFPVGDSLLETNPMFGRGCAAAFMQAELLREVLGREAEPRRRISRYLARARQQLQPYFELSVQTDHMFRVRARIKRGLAVPLPDRLLNYGYEAAWVPAMTRSVLVAREMVKAMQMREISDLKTRLTMILHIILAWLSHLIQQKTEALPDVPPRARLLESLPPAAATDGMTPS